MPRRYHVERHIRLAFYVDRLLPVQRIAPSRRSLVLPLRIELLDVIVFNSRPDVGESPADPLVVADNDERNSRQGNSGYVEGAGSYFQVRLKPQVRHLVVEVHIVRQQRFPRNRMLTGNDPIVRPRPEGINFLHRAVPEIRGINRKALKAGGMNGKALKGRGMNRKALKGRGFSRGVEALKRWGS